MKHLNTALQLEPTGILKSVEDAIKFCKFELNEVKEWRNILSEKSSEKSEKKDDSPENVKSGNKISKENRNSQGKNILIEMLLPVRIIKNVIFTGMKTVFVYTGICHENILKKNEKDFSGIVGYVSQIIKKTCTYEHENRSTVHGNSNREKEKEEVEENVVNEEQMKDEGLEARKAMVKVRFDMANMN